MKHRAEVDRTGRGGARPGCALDGHGRQRSHRPRDCAGDRDRRGRGVELRRRRRGGAPDRRRRAGGRRGRRARRAGRRAASRPARSCCASTRALPSRRPPPARRRSQAARAAQEAATREFERQRQLFAEELHQPGCARPRRGAVQGGAGRGCGPAGLGRCGRTQSDFYSSRRPTTASWPTWRWCWATWPCPAGRC